MKLFAPFINDVSTDTEEPPTFSSGSQRMGERVKNAIREHYSHIAALELERSPEEGFRLVLEAAELMLRWKLTVIDRENSILEGYAVTGLFRFRDDFVVRVRPSGSGSRVDMRSRSRTGKGDFGANAERIEAFFAGVRRLTASKS